MSQDASETTVAEGAERPPGSVDAEAHALHPLSRGSSARRRWWRDARRRRMLAVADLSAILIAGAAAAVPVSGTFWALAFAPLWLLFAKLFGLYDRDHRALRHLTADEVPAIIGWAGTSTAFLALLLPLTPAGTLGGLAAAANVAILVVAAVTLRAVARRLWWHWTPPEAVGLIGDGPSLESMRRKFGLFRDMHFALGDEYLLEDLVASETREADLAQIAVGVDRIVVASDQVDIDLISEMNSLCRRHQVKLSIVSPLRGKALPSLQITQVADLPILEYSTWDQSRSSLLLKRAFDVLVAVLGLALFALALPVTAVAIKLDSPGRVFFSQVRAGLGGRPFRMYKLRTMHVDAEAMLDEIAPLEELSEPAFKLRDDPRVTRVGRFLRRFSIDELPQLFNVLVGEMSVVGPRPEQVELVERYTPDARFRLTVKPGITGPMQVFGRGELTFAERLAVELEYVENPSIARDVRILLHTLPAVTRGTGAF